MLPFINDKTKTRTHVFLHGKNSCNYSNVPGAFASLPFEISFSDLHPAFQNQISSKVIPLAFCFSAFSPWVSLVILKTSAVISMLVA